MAVEPQALLIAEVGSVTTRVSLVDAVEGETRLIGQAEAPTTTEAPYEDPLVGIRDATREIAELTGRQLLNGDTLLMPRNSEFDGVDRVLVVTSAASPMALVIAAVSTDISARSAVHAGRASYTSIAQVITLNEGNVTGERGDGSWIERQVQALLNLRPDAVLIAGGLEDGAEDALVRLAHIVSLSTVARPDAGGYQDLSLTPVIFAGNSGASERVIEALSGKTSTVVVENVRPSLEVERLEPARRELSRLYNERILPRMAGFSGLRSVAGAPPRLSCEAAGLLTRFVAERYGRDTLTLDIGGSNTAAYLQSAGRYSPTILGGVGVGYGVGTVLAERGARAIMRWLPFPISEEELVQRLLNKMLRPHIPPANREDLLIEHAVAREALALTLTALWDERPDAGYDMVVASGGVLAHAPHPGLAALTIIDALQPGTNQDDLVFDLQLDSLGLLGVCGALAFSNADAALTLFERDFLGNTPLATLVVALGGKAGAPALEAELEVVGGDKTSLSVAQGQIGRLPLAPGRKATLTIRPANGVRIGRNAAGAEVKTPIAAIRGSALGVLIDARGRPLAFSNEPLRRQQGLWDALVALGVESSALPYAAADPLPEERKVAAPPARISDPAIEATAAVSSATTPPPASTSPSIDNDLAALRKTVSSEPASKKGKSRK